MNQQKTDINISSGIMEKRWISIRETAKYLGVSSRSIYNGTGPKATRNLPFKPRRFGKLWRFDRYEIDRYFETQ